MTELTVKLRQFCRLKPKQNTACTEFIPHTTS